MSRRPRIRFAARWPGVAVALAIAMLGAVPAASANPVSSWALTAGGTGLDSTSGVVPFPDGSSIVTGLFSGQLVLGSTTLNSSSGSIDIYVARLDASGAPVWAVKAGGAGTDQARGITAAPGGDVVIAGFYQGTPTFPTTPEVTLPQRDAPGGDSTNDLFVARVDGATGAFEWVQQGGGTSEDYIYDAAVLADGTVIVAGSFKVGATFGSDSMVEPAGSTGGNLFVARIDPAGSWVWAHNLGGSTNFDDLFGVDVLPNGNVAAAGYLRGPATLVSRTPAGRTVTLPYGGGGVGYKDALLLVLTPDGDIVTASIFGGLGDEFAYEAEAAPDGDVIVAGLFNGASTVVPTATPTTLTNAGASNTDDGFLLRVAPDGSYEWAKRFGGTGAEIGWGVDVRSDGVIALAGDTTGASSSFGSLTLATSSTDAFVALADATGAFTWVQGRGGSSTDSARGVSFGPGGTLFFSGRFTGPATFNGTSRTSAGSQDLFVERFGTGTTPPPPAPAIVGVVVGDGQATVTVERVLDATDYTVTASPGGSDCDFAVPLDACTITGLAPATVYSFSAVASGPGGSSPASVVAVPATTTGTAPAADAPRIEAPQVAEPESEAADTPAERLRIRVRRVGAAHVTTGKVPTGATRIVQHVTRAGSRVRRERTVSMTVGCPISTTSGVRRFRCRVALGRGRWTLTVEARAGASVVGTAEERVVVRGAAVESVTG